MPALATALLASKSATAAKGLGLFSAYRDARGGGGGSSRRAREEQRQTMSMLLVAGVAVFGLMFWYFHRQRRDAEADAERGRP